MNIVPMLIYLAIVVAFFAALIGLQIFLSKKKNRWYGLILPILCFLFSLIPVLSMAAFNTVTEIKMQEIAQDGTVTMESIIQQSGDTKPNNDGLAVKIMLILVIYNIPTAVLLAIYFACREKIAKNSELDKMSIQDLE